MHHIVFNILHHVLLKHENSRDEFAIGFTFSFMIYIGYTANYGISNTLLGFMVYFMYTLAMLVRCIENTELIVWQRYQDQLQMLRLYEQIIIQINQRQLEQEFGLNQNVFPEDALIGQNQNQISDPAGPAPATDVAEAGPDAPPENASEESKEEFKEALEEITPLAADSVAPEASQPPAPEEPLSQSQNEEAKDVVQPLEAPKDDHQKERAEQQSQPKKLLKAKKLGTIPEVESGLEQTNSNLMIGERFDSKDLDEGTEDDMMFNKMKKYN